MAKKAATKKNMIPVVPKRRGRPPGSKKQKVMIETAGQMELPFDATPTKPAKLTVPYEFVENLIDAVFELSQEVRRLAGTVETMEYRAARNTALGTL